MKTLAKVFGVTLFLMVLNTLSYGQIIPETSLRELPENTQMVVNKSFEISSEAKSVWLDNGKGKICSCQFFSSNTEGKTRFYQTGNILLLKKVIIKGLFDGSQMHVARIYFNNTDDYFKVKCYARDILVGHISGYLNVGSVNSVAKED